MSRLDGRVDGDEILFELSAPNGERVLVALDTGFSGELTLPLESATRLGFSSSTRVAMGELADGSSIRVDLSQGTILWLGSRRRVRAALMETPRGCIGMALLRDVVVRIDTHAGLASIERAV